MRRGEAQGPLRRLLTMVAALLVAAAASGCARPPASATAAPATAPAPAPSPTAAPATTAAVDAGSSAPATAVPDIRIDSFDCFKTGGGPDDVAGPPIGAWQGGGPGGASWNVAELQCAAVVTSTCRDGEVASELRIGRTLVVMHTGHVGAAGRTEWRFKLRQGQWLKNLDDVRDARRAAYRTAIFRLTSALTCRKPYERGPGIGPRGEFTADRAFLAGFASGE